MILRLLWGTPKRSVLCRGVINTGGVVSRKTDPFGRVRELGLALPDVVEGTVYGSPALKVRGAMFACLAIHRSAEPGSLAIRIDFDQRDELIAEDPATYYLTDHYVSYPCVLVRLGRVPPDTLRDLLVMAWRFVSTRRKRPARRRVRESRPLRKQR
jgi:hypothetical protein